MTTASTPKSNDLLAQNDQGGTEMAGQTPEPLSETQIRAAARRDFTREVRALLNFWEPAARDALTPEERDIYDGEVLAMVDRLERSRGCRPTG